MRTFFKFVRTKEPKSTDGMGRNSIKLDLAQCAVFERMTSERAGRLIKAIVRYGRDGYEVEDSDIEELFIMFKAQIDEEKREQAEKSQQRAEVNRRYYSSHIKTLRHLKTSEKETESEKEKVTQKEKGKEKEKTLKEKLVKRKDEKEQSAVPSEAEQPTLLPETQEKARKAKGKQRTAFVPPSVEEVVAYCAERDYRDVDAEKFCAYYGSIGWKVGKHDMKDWKLAVVTWHKKQGEIQQQQRQKQRPMGNSMADRAYRMVHFELEDDPEGWKEEARKWEEFKKQHGL